MRNALLVYPEYPPSYWGINFALEMLGVKAAFPPLGLLTVAAMFPPEYALRVVDMNVSPLQDSDLDWADMVFTSTMIVQRESLQKVIERCHHAGVPVVAGGPYPTSNHQDIVGVDYFVLDEVEETFPRFLRDLDKGRAKNIYREPQKPNVTQTPIPRFDLIELSDYSTMCVQFSRGCPFDCEFCDIIKLYGRVPRTKSPQQIVEEFETLYRLGWRGYLFLVDDNFIGNRRDALNLLPAIAEWQREHGFPFQLFTEASVNLARMDSVMDEMIEAGFNGVFLGIETPNPKALAITKKPQNINGREPDYLLNAVRKIQHKGMQVMGGFILGLDGDDEQVFDAQIQFIQEAGIPMSLVGLLTALKGTDLYARLQSENRLLDAPVGASATALNFVPQMNPRILIEGYLRVVSTIYDPSLESYFERCLTLFKHLKPSPHVTSTLKEHEIYLALMAVRRRLAPSQLPAYGRYIAKVSKDHPSMLPEAIRLAALGYHFEKLTRVQIAHQGFEGFLAAELSAFREAAVDPETNGDTGDNRREELMARVNSRYRSIPAEYRFNADGIDDALASFRVSVNEHADSTQLAGAAHGVPPG
ncbi:MAG: DUF4070 domain-containing protein [Caldilineaceae bacterium SB0662_bin_9]|uniref:DUF4070 domain-containing protein n=1 Tax=Caldilineaceae bacterium SB0662_bin_9 TaxID=2605258 RepID=A0A6B1DUV5_9CHLR|nr:B12-binding domain-containing radical SAM protein [Caldilineaceae bacterium]MYD91499.1 DUF4070 domain-containing protein [Caldilineaceae bacterium SB0662_bin_9]